MGIFRVDEAIMCDWSFQHLQELLLRVRQVQQALSTDRFQQGADAGSRIQGGSACQPVPAGSGAVEEAATQLPPLPLPTINGRIPVLDTPARRDAQPALERLLQLQTPLSADNQVGGARDTYSSRQR